MTVNEWISSEKTIKKSRKTYSHFDYRTDISKCKEYILNPEKISSHGFYPFIHYEKDMSKFNKDKGKVQKTRDICYAAHLDSCIYQYYSYILNEKYNSRIKELGISEVPVAYRTDLHWSNIKISHKAFDFIKNNSPCYVMIGDFTSFFDLIDHAYLKKQWKNILQLPNLPEDHYAVFKNITKFSKFELEDLLKINNLDNTKSGRKELNTKNKVLTTEEFQNYRSKIIKNKCSYGIPQGSPISATLANIYMIDIDKEIFDIVNHANGLYMRYSDDFIIVVPNANKNILKSVLNILRETKGITLEPEKTQFFLYNNNSIVNCGGDFNKDANTKKRFINFLGFTFDGENIYIRSKTVSKYYCRLYRKAKTICLSNGYTHSGHKISCKNLYEKYSIKGAYGKKGNFLSYVNRAQTEYGCNEKIDRSTKRHMIKIRKALNKNKI